MGIDLGKAFGDAAKGVTDFINKAGRDITNAIDQNGDGVLDISDLQTVSDRIQAGRAEAQRKADLERLKPVFQKDLDSAEFVMPRMICVIDTDKAHAENAVCKDSIGFKTVLDDLIAITFYREYADQLGLTFTPELDNGVYYVDPCDRDHYISLDDYFAYMKTQRVVELQQIAQALGAKHFRVTYKERRKLLSIANVAADTGANVWKVDADAKADIAKRDDSTTTIGIEADTSFPGKAPVRPQLRYLKKDANVMNLINLRMDTDSPLQHQRFNIELGNSSGIKKKDAVKIDAMIKVLKMTGNATVTSEVQNEERRILEYEIDF